MLLHLQDNHGQNVVAGYLVNIIQKLLFSINLHLKKN